MKAHYKGSKVGMIKSIKNFLGADTGPDPFKMYCEIKDAEETKEQVN